MICSVLFYVVFDIIARVSISRREFFIKMLRPPPWHDRISTFLVSRSFLRSIFVETWCQSWIYIHGEKWLGNHASAYLGFGKNLNVFRETVHSGKIIFYSTNRFIQVDEFTCVLTKSLIYLDCWLNSKNVYILYM